MHVILELFALWHKAETTCDVISAISAQFTSIGDITSESVRLRFAITDPHIHIIGCTP